MRHALVAVPGMVLVVACGGGGGGRGGDFYAGTYTHELTTVENSCSFSAPTGDSDGDGDSTVVIDQDDDRVIVRTESGRVYVGVPPGDDGSFIASLEDRVPCTNGQSATIVRRFEFSNLSGDVADVAFSDSYSDCQGSSGQACSLRQVGRARRE